MTGLTYGLKLSPQFTTVATLRDVWAIADDGAFDSAWVFDHFHALGPDPTGDVFEAWALLAAMAEATQRVRIGCVVTGNTYRHPAVLAKAAVTVDHLSGGRLEMGLGSGGHHAELGLPTGAPAELSDRLSEACRVLKLLWSAEPTATFAGRHYRLDEALANPQPVQRPHPPLWIGGSGERYALRVVAEHADVWINASPPGTEPAELARLSGVLDRHCEAIGRDPATIRRAAQFRLPPDPDEALRAAEAHARAGFTELLLMLFEAGPAAVPAAEAAAKLLPRLREVG